MCLPSLTPPPFYTPSTQHTYLTFYPNLQIFTFMPYPTSPKCVLELKPNTHLLTDVHMDITALTPPSSPICGHAQKNCAGMTRNVQNTVLNIFLLSFIGGIPLSWTSSSNRLIIPFWRRTILCKINIMCLLEDMCNFLPVQKT